MTEYVVKEALWILITCFMLLRLTKAFERILNEPRSSPKR